MSDDLVKRLRWLGDHASFEPHMHHTATDRIEKLEAELHHCFHRIEELQAALRELSTEWDCCAVSKTMKLIARKALEGKHD
jgi:hypothetical protein